MEPREENSASLEDMASRRVELSHDPLYGEFLDDLCRVGKYPAEFAEKAAEAVLCVFDQELNASTAKDPASKLPVALQELLRSCNRVGEQPPEGFDPETLIYSVAADLDVSDDEAEAAIRNVFAAVRHRLSHGQIGYVARKLPAKIQNLWYGHEHAERRLGPTGKPRDR